MRGIHWDKNGLKHGSWSPEEDQMLISYIQRYKIWNWSQMPKFAGLSRSGKSCRLRWMNYLRPDIKRGNITKEEEEIITNMYAKMGSRWSKIAERLPGRTDNEIKNYWHSHLKKSLDKNAVPRNKIQRIEIREVEIKSEASNESNIASISASESSNSKVSSSPQNNPYLSLQDCSSSSISSLVRIDDDTRDTNDMRTKSSKTNGDLESFWTWPIFYENNKEALVQPWYQEAASSYLFNSNEYWFSLLLETNLDGAS